MVDKKKTAPQGPQTIDPQKELNLVAPSLCPLCHQDNACNGEDIANCWCNDTSITFPQSVLDQVPKQAKGLACICMQCVRKYQNKS